MKTINGRVNQQEVDFNKYEKRKVEYITAKSNMDTLERIKLTNDTERFVNFWEMYDLCKQKLETARWALDQCRV